MRKYLEVLFVWNKSLGIVFGYKIMTFLIITNIQCFLYVCHPLYLLFLRLLTLFPFHNTKIPMIDLLPGLFMKFLRNCIIIHHSLTIRLTQMNNYILIIIILMYSVSCLLFVCSFKILYIRGKQKNQFHSFTK